MKPQMATFNSQIRVIEPVEDEIITERLHSAFMQDALLNDTCIHIVTVAGGVELSGFVGKFLQKQRALMLAADMQGVAYVVNNLMVRD